MRVVDVVGPGANGGGGGGLNVLFRVISFMQQGVDGTHLGIPRARLMQPAPDPARTRAPACGAVSRAFAGCAAAQARLASGADRPCGLARVDRARSTGRTHPMPGPCPVCLARLARAPSAPGMFGCICCLCASTAFAGRTGGSWQGIRSTSTTPVTTHGAPQQYRVQPWGGHAPTGRQSPRAEMCSIVLCIHASCIRLHFPRLW